jgi:4-hydroxy-tetrahydrodipicolinate reductase
VLTSIQRQLNALALNEYADLSQRNSPELLFDLMGFGRPAGPFEQFRDYLRSSFGPSLRLVADAIGLPLDSVEASGGLATASRDVPIAASTLREALLHNGSPSRASGPSRSPRDRVACVGRRRRAT